MASYAFGAAVTDMFSLGKSEAETVLQGRDGFLLGQKVYGFLDSWCAFIGHEVGQVVIVNLENIPIEAGDSFLQPGEEGTRIGAEVVVHF